MPVSHGLGRSAGRPSARWLAALLGLLRALPLTAAGSAARSHAEVLALVQRSLRVRSHPHHQHDDGGFEGLGTVAYEKLEEGDVLAGQLECSFGQVGLRIRLSRPLSSARLELFPKPKFDQNSHMWCRPTTACAGTLNATVDWRRPALALKPAAGGTAENSCGWPAFTLKGSVSPGSDGLKFKGQLSSSTLLSTSLVRREGSDTGAPVSWLPPKCHLYYVGVQQGMPTGACSSFSATVCRRDVHLKEGDKVLYFIRHGEQRNQPEDGNLTALGQRQVHNLRSNPMLARALSADPNQRAEIILASPMARTMQTAVAGFSDLGIKTELDMDLIEFANEPTKGEGEALLKNLGTPQLLDQYKRMWKSTDKGYELDWAGQGESAGVESVRLEERVARFLADLQKRPEQRIIVVGHNNYFKSTGIYVKGFATMAARVLGRDGKLRETSPPECWPDSMVATS